MLHMTDIRRPSAVGRILLLAGTLWILFGLGLQTGWADTSAEISVLGLVKNRPDSVTGFGTWLVEETPSGALYTVIVDNRTTITPTMPNMGDQVEVRGVTQGSTPILAIQLSRKSDNANVNKLYGWVKSRPANGNGEWVLRLRQDTTQTVWADNTTRFPQGIPAEGKAVEIRYVLQDGTRYRARVIRPDDYEAQQLIARLRTGVTTATITSRYSLTYLTTLLPSANIHLFQTPEDAEGNLVERLNADPDIAWAELNYVGHVPVGNPKRVWNWGGINATGYVNQHAFEQVNVAPALTYYRGEGTIVAVIDTGADLNHEALRDHLAAPAVLWDMVADDPIPFDEGPGFAQGHGTHIAGIIAHMAPASKLMILRALDANGRGNTATVAYAIEWAVDHGADVINLSLGADFDARILKLAVTSALADGVVIVAAAGNDNTSTRQYPAGYADVLSVTAVDAANIKADFANYSAAWVKIAAPGVGITSSIVGPQGSGYASWSGTSMSTAFVSGAAALLRQKDGDADVAAITNRLRNRADDLDSTNPSHAGQLGGLLDVSAALDVPAATPVPTTTPEPTATNTPTPIVVEPLPTVTATPPPPTPHAGEVFQYVYLSIVKAAK